jgi:hypothetical protein
VNLLVDYSPDKGRILAEALPAKVIRVFREHGVQSREVHRWFKTFVLGGEASVRVEIICSDYAETLEGEIGRCMHEDRIIRQRQRPEYQGQLAQNVEFLHRAAVHASGGARRASRSTPGSTLGPLPPGLLRRSQTDALSYAVGRVERGLSHSSLGLTADAAD